MTILKNNRYLHILESSTETTDIGKWTDEHILNKINTPIEEYEKCFTAPSPSFTDIVNLTQQICDNNAATETYFKALYKLINEISKK